MSRSISIFSVDAAAVEGLAFGHSRSALQSRIFDGGTANDDLADGLERRVRLLMRPQV